MNEYFGEWLEDWLTTIATAALEQLELDVYLQASERFEIAAGERLRKLAIAVEARAMVLEPRRAWTCVERIYTRALELAPDHAWIHESRAISASFMAECADDLDDLVREAERSFARGRARARRRNDRLWPRQADLSASASVGRAGACPLRARAEPRSPVRLGGPVPRPLSARSRALARSDRRLRGCARARFRRSNRLAHGCADRAAGLVSYASGHREGALAELERMLARYEAEPQRMVEHDLLYLPCMLDSFPQLRERFTALERLADALRLGRDDQGITTGATVAIIPSKLSSSLCPGCASPDK